MSADVIALGQQLGAQVGAALPPGTGFVLLLVTPNGSVAHTTNMNKAGLHAVLTATADRVLDGQGQPFHTFAPRADGTMPEGLLNGWKLDLLGISADGDLLHVRFREGPAAGQEDRVPVAAVTNRVMV